MEPYRPSLRRQLASLIGSFRKLFIVLKPEAEQSGRQRMCPFCGLITPRAERCCLECGKPLRGIPSEPKNARQG
jgi:hypothetical protein